MDRRAQQSMERIEQDLADHIAEAVAITVDLREDADSAEPDVDVIPA